MNIGTQYDIHLSFMVFYLNSYIKFCFSSKIKSFDNIELILTNSSGNPVMLNWSGINIAAGLRIPLFRHSKK
jgi:hypothetical protein